MSFIAQIPPPNKPSPNLVQALLSLSSGLQQLGVCLDGDSRKEWATSTLEHFTSAYLDHLDRPSCGSDLQHIFDLVFLRELVGLWSIDPNGVLGRVSATITHLAEVSVRLNPCFPDAQICPATACPKCQVSVEQPRRVGSRVSL